MPLYDPKGTRWASYTTFLVCGQVSFFCPPISSLCALALIHMYYYFKTLFFLPNLEADPEADPEASRALAKLESSGALELCAL